MKVIVVDDSIERVKRIATAVANSPFVKYVELVSCDSADGARRELTSSFDLMVLDVLIPKKRGGTPQALHSVNLISDVCNPKKKFIRPRLVVGLTADLTELGTYRNEFFRHASIVLDGSANKRDWLDSLLEQIESLVSAERKSTQFVKDRTLISVHGIRTYGKWQAELSKEILQYSRDFDFVEIKYGFLDILSFAIPSLRRKKIREAATQLIACLEKSADRDIYIVAHSFGTLIVADALLRYQPSRLLKGVMFCGSPLPHKYPIGHVVDQSELTLNECGIHDFVLILARLFLLGLGDAGRVGFSKENSSRFMNRFFVGGHGLYFSDFKGLGKFYDLFWLSFIAAGRQPEGRDGRENYFGEDLVNFLITLLTFLKPVLYFVGAGLLIWNYIF